MNINNYQKFLTIKIQNATQLPKELVSIVQRYCTSQNRDIAILFMQMLTLTGFERDRKQHAQTEQDIKAIEEQVTVLDLSKFNFQIFDNPDETFYTESYKKDFSGPNQALILKTYFPNVQQFTPFAAAKIGDDVLRFSSDAFRRTLGQKKPSKAAVQNDAKPNVKQAFKQSQTKTQNEVHIVPSKGEAEGVCVINETESDQKVHITARPGENGNGFLTYVIPPQQCAIVERQAQVIQVIWTQTLNTNNQSCCSIM